MKKSISYINFIIVSAIILITFFSSSVIFAQEHKSSCCGNEMEKDKMRSEDTTKHSSHKMDMDHGMHNMKMGKHKSHEVSSIVRKGEIDLKAIDENNDGKVFQDQMDWNVISDKAGNCPLCNMTLKEVSITKAKENLIKNGFKVK